MATSFIVTTGLRLAYFGIPWWNVSNHYTSLQLLARNPTTTFWRLLRCWQLAVFLQVVSHMFMLPCARGEGSTGIACGLFFAPVSFITGMLACTIEVGSFWTTTTSHASSYFRLLIQFSWVIFLFLLQFEAVHQFFWIAAVWDNKEYYLCVACVLPKRQMDSLFDRNPIIAIFYNEHKHHNVECTSLW